MDEKLDLDYLDFEIDSDTDYYELDLEGLQLFEDDIESLFADATNQREEFLPVRNLDVDDERGQERAQDVYKASLRCNVYDELSANESTNDASTRPDILAVNDLEPCESTSVPFPTDILPKNVSRLAHDRTLYSTKDQTNESTKEQTTFILYPSRPSGEVFWEDLLLSITAHVLSNNDEFRHERKFWPPEDNLTLYHSTTSNNKQITISMTLLGKKLRLLLDSGSPINVLLPGLVHSSYLRPSTVSANSASGHPLPATGGNG